jgi:hypothetical protein
VQYTGHSKYFSLVDPPPPPALFMRNGMSILKDSFSVIMTKQSQNGGSILSMAWGRRLAIQSPVNT